MKKYSLILIGLFLLPLFSLAQQEHHTNPNGYNKFYYPNGKLSSEGTLKDGKPDGYWKTYYKNGTLKSEGNRKNFELDSVWNFYDNKGHLMLEYTYKKGKKNGDKTTFAYDKKDSTFYMASRENYRNDTLQGFAYYYHPNGKLQEKVNYIDGMREGRSFEYNSDSVIITVIHYKMGFVKSSEKINRKDRSGLKEGLWQQFYPNGNVKWECTYTAGKKDGYFKTYKQDGSLIDAEKYVNGVLQKNAPELAKMDVKSDYYPGGKVKSTMEYKNGVPDGTYREYSMDGKVTASKIYDNGKVVGEGILNDNNLKEGKWKEYYDNGQIKAEGVYKNGKRIGPWIFYYANGKVMQKGKYDNRGREQGNWKWYYEDGNLLRNENYYNGYEDGKMVEYSDSGAVITKGAFLEGLKEGPWVYQMGDYKSEGSYKADLRDGEWKEFYNDNGKLRFKGNYINGTPDGKHTYFYRNGKIKEVGKYVGGQKDGEWKYYSEDGAVYLTILYQNGVEVKFDGVKVKPTNQESVNE